MGIYTHCNINPYNIDILGDYLRNLCSGRALDLFYRMNEYLIRVDHLGAVRCLVEGCGFDFHKDDLFLISCSSSLDHIEVVKYLVECGVDIRTESDCGFEMALYYGCEKVIEYLCGVYVERCGVEWCLTSKFEELRKYAKGFV